MSIKIIMSFLEQVKIFNCPQSIIKLTVSKQLEVAFVEFSQIRASCCLEQVFFKTVKLNIITSIKREDRNSIINLIDAIIKLVIHQ